MLITKSEDEELSFEYLIERNDENIIFSLLIIGGLIALLIYVTVPLMKEPLNDYSSLIGLIIILSCSAPILYMLILHIWTSLKYHGINYICTFNRTKGTVTYYDDKKRCLKEIPFDKITFVLINPIIKGSSLDIKLRLQNYAPSGKYFSTHKGFIFQFTVVHPFNDAWVDSSFYYTNSEAKNMLRDFVAFLVWYMDKDRSLSIEELSNLYKVRKYISE